MPSKFESLRQIVSSKLEELKIKEETEEEEARQKREAKENAENKKRLEELQAEAFVKQNHSRVKQRSIELLNECNGGVFENEAEVIGWRRVEDRKRTEYGHDAMSDGGASYATNHDYQYIYDQSSLIMPREKKIDLEFLIEERHWDSGKLDNKRSRKIDQAEQKYLRIHSSHRFDIIDIGRPFEQVDKELEERISMHIKMLYR